MKNRKGGFTLVELMVVAVIVAILAAVAIPLMSANKKRAIATEAEAGCGTIRTALRALYAETDAYNADQSGNPIVNVTDIPGISATDLDGKYFDTAAYAFAAGEPTASTYIIVATGNNSGAPSAADAGGIVLQLDQNGAWSRTLP